MESKLILIVSIIVLCYSCYILKDNPYSTPAKGKYEFKEDYMDFVIYKEGNMTDLTKYQI